MAEPKKTEGSLALNTSPRFITIPAAEQTEPRKLRVAAYCRVSSDSRDQLNSFAAQNAYYARDHKLRASLPMEDTFYKKK